MPGHVLMWTDSDQKPMWFRYAAAQRTLAPRGSRSVFVKENMPATRERFAVMTRTQYPSLPDDGKEVAV
eukprot:8649181-Alexandrium_andersonii.AAC.1